jgi:hypothetical protein
MQSTGSNARLIDMSSQLTVLTRHREFLREEVEKEKAAIAEDIPQPVIFAAPDRRLRLPRQKRLDLLIHMLAQADRAFLKLTGSSE